MSCYIGHAKSCSTRYAESVMNDSAFQEHDKYMISRMVQHGRWIGKESWSRPSRIAINHASKDLDSTLYTLAGSAPGYMLLLPPIRIQKVPLPPCSHPYTDPTD